MDRAAAPPTRRQPLSGQWSICAEPPAGVDAPAPGAQVRWTAIEGPAPVAAALRELKQWSLDDPPTTFDAQDWWYRVRFDRPPAAPGERVVLGFDGLATLAQVRLNGQPLLASDNMFLAHECDVSGALEASGNELMIRLRSLDAELARRRPRPRWRAPMIAHQQLRWVRTTLLGRTPGWSPPAAVVGPWRDIWLERRDPLQPRDVGLEVSVDGTAGVVRCHLELPDGASGESSIVTLELARGGAVHAQRLGMLAGTRSYAGELRLDDVRLWWPHTHGEPCRYRAALVVETPARSARFLLGAVGFRTIELDTRGEGFRVVVNGTAVFCRGACWTPLDPVSLRAAPAHYRAAIAQVCAAGMNMLRVTGTTVYEEDAFYDACDECGVLVWQDFMFANMDYPADDPAFMESVTLEARQQLRRLHARPCLAVLCGNSEVEQQAAMWGAPRELWRPALFEQTLAQLCAEHARGIAYWPSSAHGGAFPHQANVGTTSYYGVGAYLRPIEDARRAGLKFATECLAFANIPGADALQRMPGGVAARVHHAGWKARSPRDLGAGWDFDDVRDHYLRTLFGVDPQQVRATDHERYLELGRAATGETMAAAFSEWRRPASGCGGALVLSLRDLWAGAGWGVLDDAGAPKACYHFLKRVLQPVTVLITDEGGNGLYAHVINERAQELPLRLEFSAWRDGEIQVAGGQHALVAAARSAQSLPLVELLPSFMDLSYAYRFGPMPCDAVAVTLRDRDGAQVAQAFHFPGPAGMPPRAELGLRASMTMLDAGRAELAVSARRLARGVHVDVPGFEPSDNWFHLAPECEVRIALRGEPGRPARGAVHALNSIRPALVEASPAASAALHLARTI